MPDTLIDPVRPTLIDDAAPDAGDDEPHPDGEPPRAPAAPPTPPRSRMRAWLALGIAVIAAAALGAYFFLWRYEPTARRHIPGNANVAVRIEAADLILFAPVRKHLWPLLDDSSSGKARGARLKEATGLDLAGDIREILIASTDAASWVVLAGGRIPRGRFVKGVDRIAREEGWTGWRRDSELLVGPAGVALGQADDGTIVAGTDAGVVKAALPASDEWQRLDLPERGAVTFALTEQAWSGAAGPAGALLPRAGAVFRRVARASGAMSLGEAPSVTMRLSPVAGEPAAAVATDVQALLGQLKLITLVLPYLAGEKGALGTAKAEAKGDAVELRAEWPYEGLDRACAELARALRSARIPRAAGSSSAPPR